MRNIVLSPSRVSSPAFPRFILTLFLAMGFTSAMEGQVATTTQLTIPVSTLATRGPTLLTATVTDTAGHPVLLGMVTFYDGARSLGSAQIVSGTSGAYPQGTANLRTASFAPGASSITAVFSGTKTDATSTSAAKTLTVTGGSRTLTTLNGYVTGTDFWLPATVRAFGSTVPTGNVDFVHKTVGTIETKSLVGAKWKTDLSIGSTPKVSTGPVAVVTGDFNGDGFADLATCNPFTSAAKESVSILLGNGDGTFTPHVDYPDAGNAPINIYAADFNNDGRLDLVVLNSQDNKTGILLGNGDGTFQSMVEYGSEHYNDYAYIGDLDRDGKLDIVLLNQSASGAGSVGVLLGNGDGTFQTQTNYAVGLNTYAIAGGDLNGDSIPDLLVTSGEGANVLLGKGDGSFRPATVYPALIGYPVVLADMNRDGKLDAVIAQTRGTSLSVSLGKGNGTFEPPQTFPLPGGPSTPIVADFNQDGFPDIAIGTSDYVPADDRLQLLLGNGDGTFQPAEAFFQNVNVDLPITGDFNGDGRPDVAAVDISGDTANAVAVILNSQTARVSIAREGLGPGTTTVEAIYSGDGDFDGSTSNAVKLIQNGTPPPSFGMGFRDLKTGLLTPAAQALEFNGSAIGGSISGNGILLTTAFPNEAGSMFYGAPQNIEAFTTDFDFQVRGVDAADGLTFTIQNEGSDALGGAGGGLGYKHISKSVAIKFDLFNNNGEGENSTGLYTNGEAPETPAVDLTGTGINLHSAVNGGPSFGEGDAFDVHITYDGTSLSMTITDVYTFASYSHSWPVDIPAEVGGTTAYVGFTAGTGGHFANDQLDTWTYLPGMP